MRSEAVMGVEAERALRGAPSPRESVEALIERRGSLVAQVQVIDGELRPIFERLLTDRPADVPALAVPLALATSAPHSGRIIPDRQSCAYDVLCGVTKGLATPRELRAAYPTWSADRIKHALGFLVDGGWLTRTGRTNHIRYTLRQVAPEPTA